MDIFMMILQILVSFLHLVQPILSPIIIRINVQQIVHMDIGIHHQLDAQLNVQAILIVILDLEIVKIVVVALCRLMFQLNHVYLTAKQGSFQILLIIFAHQVVHLQVGLISKLGFARVRVHQAQLLLINNQVQEHVKLHAYHLNLQIWDH